jgi:serine/threonine-protein kinase RsbW
VSATDTVRHNGMKSEVMVLAHEPRAVALARRHVRDELAALGLTGVVLDDVALVISELVGNAVLHARPLSGGRLEVTWWVGSAGVHVRVTDGGSPGAVALREDGVAPVPGGLDDSGRGLMIVDRLAVEWGVDDEGPARRTVWAVLPVPRSGPVLRAVR